MSEHRPPFVVDYLHDGRLFSFILLGPASWPEAEAHVASIAATARVEGSDVVELPAKALGLWTAHAEALLAAYAEAGQARELAVAGAAVMLAGHLADHPQSQAQIFAQLIEAAA